MKKKKQKRKVRTSRTYPKAAVKELVIWADDLAKRLNRYTLDADTADSLYFMRKYLVRFRDDAGLS